MRSFALWYNATDPNATKKEVEVHINLWDKSICGGARDDIQIDLVYWYLILKVSMK